MYYDDVRAGIYRNGDAVGDHEYKRQVASIDKKFRKSAGQNKVHKMCYSCRIRKNKTYACVLYNGLWYQLQPNVRQLT